MDFKDLHILKTALAVRVSPPTRRSHPHHIGEMSTRITRKRLRCEVDQEAEHVEAPAEDPILPGTSDSNMQDVETKLDHWKKDEEFWFGDGTVILVAGDVEFRVYAGLLSARSPVLKVIFEQRDYPHRKVSMPDGSSFRCAVVSLPESPEDLRHLLRAYMPGHGARYDNSSLVCAVEFTASRFFTSEAPSYYAISASIRLGRKYHLTELYDQALQYLKVKFPADFEGWHALHDWVPVNFAKEHAIGVVNLARLTGELSILPAAFLVCLSLEASVVDGFVREDGTSEHLTLADLGRCIKGQGSMRNASVSALLNAIPSTPPSMCEVNCKVALRRIHQDLKKNIDELVTIQSFASLYDGFIPTDTRICYPCRNLIDEMHEKERAAVWSRLPELLDLEVPNWVSAEPLQA